MSLRRLRPKSPAEREPDAADESGAPGHTGPLTDRPHSLEAAEAQYVAARDAWVAAMRRANSGRPADLASLAIRQEAYEQATADVERWRAAPRVAIRVEPDAKRVGIEVAIGQEMAWKRVHERPPDAGSGPIGRFVRRFRGRG